MASAGRRQMYGSGTPITKSRRWRPQIDGGGDLACTRLYFRDCYPPRLLFLLLPFSSFSSFSSPLPRLIIILLLFSSSSSSFPPLLLLFLFSSFPPPIFLLFGLF